MKKGIFFIILLNFSNLLIAQTPKTWFYNDFGQKTTVKEKWDEDENGFKHGKYIRYDYSYIGNQYYVVEVGTYVHGKQSGEWKLFYANGEVCDVGNFVNDFKSGKWKEAYNKDLKIFQEGSYSNNTRIGEWINTNDQNQLLPKTEKGFRTIYENGLPSKIFNPSGEDILLKEKIAKEQSEKERLERLKLAQYQEQMEDDFKNAMNMYEDMYKYHGDTSSLYQFIKKYPDADTEYLSKAKEAIKNKKDNDAFYYANNDLANYIKYQKNFPNGIHITEVNKLVRNGVVGNINDFITGINSKLEKGNATKSIELCELVLMYKSELHNSQFMPIVIYYSLSLWSVGSKDKAVEVLKPYWNLVINYSDGDKKFKDKFFVIYDQYKNQLKIEGDKETYKKIKAL